MDDITELKTRIATTLEANILDTREKKEMVEKLNREIKQNLVDFERLRNSLLSLLREKKTQQQNYLSSPISSPMEQKNV